MITVWRGSANQWDCDEMGHMNVRVYVEKAIEGLGVLAAKAEMPFAFVANAPSTWIVEDQHIRYMREVLPGRPLTMESCVIEVTECHAIIYQQILHSNGDVAAAFRIRVRHANSKSGVAFPWSKRTRMILESLIGTPPTITAPKGVMSDGPLLPPEQVSFSKIKDINAPLIGLGMVLPEQCDVHGRMLPAMFLGKTSDAVPNLLYEWRNEVVSAAGEGVKMGAAVVEYRLVYRGWPKAGDTIAVYASLNWASEKAHSLVYWTLNPVTGQVWMTSQAVALTFDLVTRKALPTPEASLQALEELAPIGLTI